MRIECNYADLLTNLQDVSEVVEDSMLTESLRNVVFEVRENALALIGVNQLITFRREIPAESCAVLSFDGTDEVVYLQFRSKELYSFLNSYKSLRKTEVAGVSFEVKESHVVCIVTERDTDTGIEAKSAWTFPRMEVQAGLLRQLDLPKVTGVEDVSCESLLFLTKNMLPLLQAGTSLYSKLVLSEDYAIVFGQTFVSFIRNVVGGALSNVVLNYREAVFIDRVLARGGSVRLGRTDRHLYFETENSVAYLVYDNRMPNYEMYLSKFKRDHAFTVDRVYLMDALKRLKLLPESIDISYGVDGLTLKNSKYTQTLMVLQEKCMSEFGGFHFKVMPDVVSKAVIGVDEEFSGELYVYYCPQDNRTALLVFSDDSGSWISCLSIKSSNA